MKIDSPHFISTVTISVIVATILCFVARRRLRHSWRWRLVISLVIGMGIAPTIYRSQSGVFSDGLLSPAAFPLLHLSEFFSDRSLYTLVGVEALFILMVLPIAWVAALVFFLWSGMVFLRSRHETDAT